MGAEGCSLFSRIFVSGFSEALTLGMHLQFLKAFLGWRKRAVADWCCGF